MYKECYYTRTLNASEEKDRFIRLEDILVGSQHSIGGVAKRLLFCLKLNRMNNHLKVQCFVH